MQEKPNLADAAIITALRESYGLTITALEFMPVGNDSSAWAYRVTTADDAVYFLKVRKGALNMPSLTIPHLLYDRGIEQVVAPLPAQAGGLYQQIDSDFSQILYPYINGDVGMGVGLSREHWMTFGTVLGEIHAQAIPPEVQATMRQETFDLHPKWTAIVRRLQTEIGSTAYTDAAQTELAAFWGERSAEIQRILDRAIELGQTLQKQSHNFVLCHADIHTANVLLDRDDGRLFIIDWDEIIMAPKERDLMFTVHNAVGGAPVGEQETAAFLAGYGASAINWTALAYYRYEWVVQELGDFGERVFYMEDVGDVTRQHSVEGLKELFAPGNVVEAAYRSEEKL